MRVPIAWGTRVTDPRNMHRSYTVEGHDAGVPGLVVTEKVESDLLGVEPGQGEAVLVWGPKPTGSWTLTHAGTGLLVVRREDAWPTIEEARAVALMLAPLAGWTMSYEELLAGGPAMAAAIETVLDVFGRDNPTTGPTT